MEEIHPCATIKDVKKDVPRDLKIARDLSETPHPTDEEADFTRNAPSKSAGRELSLELTITNIDEVTQGVTGAGVRSSCP